MGTETQLSLGRSACPIPPLLFSCLGDMDSFLFFTLQSKFRCCLLHSFPGCSLCPPYISVTTHECPHMTMKAPPTDERDNRMPASRRAYHPLPPSALHARVPNCSVWHMLHHIWPRRNGIGDWGVASCIVRPTTPAVKKYGYKKVRQQAGKRKDGGEKKLEIRFISL